jgi:hypothetical protein
MENTGNLHARFMHCLPAFHADSRRSGRFGGRRIRQAHHLEREAEAHDGGEERNEKRDLKRPGPGVLVDTQDLSLNLRGLACELLLQLRVAHHLGVVLEDLGDLLLVLGRQDVAGV